jgi:hypothetical protein
VRHSVAPSKNTAARKEALKIALGLSRLAPQTHTIRLKQEWQTGPLLADINFWKQAGYCVMILLLDESVENRLRMVYAPNESGDLNAHQDPVKRI